MKNYCTLGIFCLSLFLWNLNAQTHNWTGNGGDSNWFNTANWDAGTLPIETSTVSVVGNVIVNISSASAEAYTIDVHNGATLELVNDLETGSIITVHPNGTFTFISGTLTGSGVLNNGLFKLEGSSQRTFNQTTITNHDTFLITNTGITQVLNTTINNGPAGLIDIASVGGFLQQSTTSVLNNEGLLRKSPDGLNPVGNFYLIFEINNTGIIEAEEDQIFLMLASAATFTNYPEGRIIGKGTYDITSTFINEGTISPGDSPNIGTINITNNFSLNGGSVELDIAGNQSEDFDQILVTGGPSMNGLFDLHLLFAPQLGDEFPVITWSPGGNSCNFPQFTSTVFEGMVYTFESFCNSNDVTLRVSDISVLGLDDVTMSETEFFIHPNPVSGDGTFVFSSEWITSEETTLVIYNYLGQQVLKMVGFTSEKNRFQRGNLPGGLYFATLETEGKVIATTRIVLN
jgi:hypothetical protein